jgi:hypothetical protein
MAKMSFSAANKSADTENFPKLKLDQDESARIALFEDPEIAFVHNLRAPNISNGEVVYKMVDTKGGGRERQMDFTFVGNPICLGDEDTLAERGMDPKNCPACKAAQDNPDQFQPPKRRFAMHVFQYTTNGSSRPTKNFQGSVKVWAFTDQKFNEIIDISEEAPNNDPRQIDLILGPCENKLFQKFKILPGKSSWMENEDSTRQFKEIIAENKAKDIKKFLGRSTNKSWLQDDLNKVTTKWKIANGQKNETANDGLAVAEPSLDAGLAGLLDTKVDLPKATESKSYENKTTSDSNNEPVDFDELLKLEGL